MISKRCSKGACRLKPKPLPASAALYRRIAQILESARSGVARTVNTTQVVANWLIGREIVEAEQRGKKRAQYGERLLEELSKKLTEDFGAGFSVQGLRYMRQFYHEFPVLISQPPIRLTLRGMSSLLSGPAANNEIHHTPCGELDTDSNGGTPAEWKPGQLSPNLSWSLYRHLLRVALPEARAFYEIEAIQNRWSARELERQINSLLYDRLAASRDKKGLLRLARNGQEIAGPLDVFKDPLVLEFLKILPAAKLVESELESALLSQLQAFLLELGKGFAFVARQQRLTLDGDHFYIDLVFYHTVLKCYVLLDLKVGKLTHQDLGQLQLYVNYFDRERLTPGDQPTLGLILCTDKNDAVVKYTLGPDQEQRIFASRYQLHLPTVAQLRAELKRELRFLS